jgi:hypothetical protein
MRNRNIKRSQFRPECDSVKPVKAEMIRDSGAWKGGDKLEIIVGVSSTTLGGGGGG